MTRSDLNSRSSTSSRLLDSDSVTIERAAVQRWRELRLDEVAERGEARRQRHPPHLRVHVVQPGDVRRACPHRGEERHPVPDLDQAVAPAVPAHHLAEGRAGEHEVPTGLADHAVPVAPAHDRSVRRIGGTHRHLDAGFGPQRGDVRGVDLGSAGFGVVEVTPREDAHALETRLTGDVAEFRDLEIVVRRVGAPGRLGCARALVGTTT